VRTIRSIIIAVIAVALLSVTAVAHDVSPPRSPAEVCDPAAIPFDPEDIHLTGRWAATDGGMYFVRQVGDTVWWNGMSDFAQKYGEIGRDFNNVGKGTLVDGTISAEFADVPRGNIWGNGHLSLKVEADAEGNLQVRRLSGDFGGDIFWPCAEVRAVTEFARPFTYQVPFGMGSVTWPGTPDQKVVMSAEEPDAGLTIWVVGPGWATVCSVPPGTPIPTDHSPESVLEYLRAHPDLEVSEATASTVDGRPALSVDITTVDGATGCNGDRYVRFWKQSGFEGGLEVGASTHLVLVDVDGATLAFEIWDARSSTWLPRAQAIIDSVRFDVDEATSQAVGESDDDGARIVRVDVLDERTRDLTIVSPSVGYARVRLLLPDGFEGGSTVAWPTLYLLHGAEDDYTSWTRETDVSAIEELRNVLVVMPDAGRWGWYTDWSNRGDGGQPAWETFHTQELPELLERDWGASPNRAVAGLSMGGFGALSYAARNPGFYKAAAAYSGVVDTVGSDFQADDLMWGDKVAEATTWEAHNPLSQAAALAGTPLYLSYGDGDPGPLDADGTGADGLESWLASQNDALVARLKELGVPVTVDAYGDGTHSWPYWERGLRDSLPLLLGALAE
jgi:S-formylglutathione hydrolase FrmB